MNKLVMNFLVTEGYVEVVEKFRKESGTEPDIDLATITDWMAVKKAVQCGDVEDAIEKVNDLNPKKPQLVKGNMQLFPVDQQRSQALEVHAASFTSSFRMAGNDKGSMLISFATKTSYVISFIVLYKYRSNLYCFKVC